MTMPTTIPYIDQFFGVWAMRSEELHAFHQVCIGLDVERHLSSAQAIRAKESPADETPQVEDGIAIVQLSGTLMKQKASIGNTTSTVLARRQLRAAVADREVNGIFLHIESPGGTARGTYELAADVAAAAKKKPLYAFIEDLGASAAYWAASAATKVYANAPALVGSIGTYAVVFDESAMAEKMGVKVHVIRAGEFKGLGESGTKITAEQLAEMQRTIDSTNAFFLQGVADGRRLPLARVKELGDGPDPSRDRCEVAGPDRRRANFRRNHAAACFRHPQTASDAAHRDSAGSSSGRSRDLPSRAEYVQSGKTEATQGGLGCVGAYRAAGRSRPDNGSRTC
jgi:signal peptide peptidase SppA